MNVPRSAGSFLGSLSTVKSHQLGSLVIREVLARAGVDPAEVSEVIMGQVSQWQHTMACQ